MRKEVRIADLIKFFRELKDTVLAYLTALLGERAIAFLKALGWEKVLTGIFYWGIFHIVMSRSEDRVKSAILLALIQVVVFLPLWAYYRFSGKKMKAVQDLAGGVAWFFNWVLAKVRPDRIKLKLIRALVCALLWFVEFFFTSWQLDPFTGVISMRRNGVPMPVLVEGFLVLVSIAMVTSWWTSVNTLCSWVYPFVKGTLWITLPALFFAARFYYGRRRSRQLKLSTNT